jgi:hypothetical protein
LDGLRDARCREDRGDEGQIIVKNWVPLSKKAYSFGMKH